jgi:hyperosmotically inducible periplasmic protein
MRHLRLGAAARTIIVAACMAGAGGAALGAQQPPAPDNTKTNERDRAKGAVTADQQSNAKSDVEITREIRKAIVADKDLSTNAHNIKIVTRQGKVTLKGPVASVDEKNTVEAKATEVVGAANVTNQISIAPKKSTAKKPNT